MTAARVRGAVETLQRHAATTTREDAPDAGGGYQYVYAPSPEHKLNRPAARPAGAEGSTEVGELHLAAQAVVDRWDTPNWKEAAPTADAINRLRRALAPTRDASDGEGE